MISVPVPEAAQAAERHGRRALEHDPAPTDRRVGKASAVLAIVLGGGIAGVVVTALALRPNFWTDEATLFLALQHATDLSPGQPLSEYEASAPYGIVLLYKAMISVFGLNEIVLRLPSALAFLCGVAIVWRTASRMAGPAAAVVALATAGCTMTTLQESTQFKQWSFEFLAACVVLALGAECRRLGTWPAFGRFTAAAILLNLVANTVILVSVAVLVGIAAAALVERPRRPLVRSPLLPSTAIIGVTFAVWYLSVVRPANAFQLALPVYATSPGLAGLWRVCLFAVEPAAIANSKAGTIFAHAFFLLLAVAVVLAIIRRDRAQCFIVVATVVLFVELAVGAETGVIPVLADRNVIMTVPLVAVAFASLLIRRWRRNVPALGNAPAVALVSVLTAGSVVLLVATGLIATVPLEQVGTVLKTSAARACGSIVPFYLASPPARLYAGSAGVATKMVYAGDSAASGVGENGWEFRVRNHLVQQASVAINAARKRPGPLCIVVGRIPFAGEVTVLLDRAGREVGPCTTVVSVTGATLSQCSRKSA